MKIISKRLWEASALVIKVRWITQLPKRSNHHQRQVTFATMAVQWQNKQHATNSTHLYFKIHVIRLVITEVRSASARGAPWRVLLQHYYVAVLSMHRSLMLQMLYFSSLSVVSCTFSVRCVYLTFMHHPHPLRLPLCQIWLFCGLHCWASPWRKIAYQVLNHSPSLFDAHHRAPLYKYKFWPC